MIQFGEKDTVPFIGQLLHYHPDANTRLAAFCVEVLPVARDTGGEIIRPNVNLQICKPDGKWEFKKNVEPLDPDEEGIEGRWTFPNEHPVEIKDETVDDEELLGTNNNCHVT